MSRDFEPLTVEEMLLAALGAGFMVKLWRDCDGNINADFCRDFKLLCNRAPLLREAVQLGYEAAGLGEKEGK